MSKKQQRFSSLSDIVYSTNPDSLPKEEPESIITLPPAQQNLRVWIEKNHRGGKIATIIKEFKGQIKDLEELGRWLKTSCGTGGSVKDGEIIIQGHHADKIVKLLIDKGYKAKRAGG